MNSVWLVQEYASNKEGVANQYSIVEKILREPYQEDRKNYDSINMLFLYPKKPSDEKDTSFQNLLYVLISNKIGTDKKLAILGKQFEIKVTKDIEEGVMEVSNILLQYERIGREEGLMEGMQIGKVRGEQHGKISTTLSHIKRLLQKKQMNLKEAFDLLDVDSDMQKKVLEELSKEEKEISNLNE